MFNTKPMKFVKVDENGFAVYREVSGGEKKEADTDKKN